MLWCTIQVNLTVYILNDYGFSAQNADRFALDILYNDILYKLLISTGRGGWSKNALFYANSVL